MFNLQFPEVITKMSEYLEWTSYYDNYIKTGVLFVFIGFAIIMIGLGLFGLIRNDWETGSFGVFLAVLGLILEIGACSITIKAQINQAKLNQMWNSYQTQQEEIKND